MAKIVKALETPEAQKTLTHELLGEYVRARRTQLGLAIDDAAAFCGVAKDTLMNLEHGNPKVQLGSALQVCKGLGIRIEILPWDDEEKKDVWV
ncbi:MAG: helix-turn-helix domain-containing protein [Gammaproteobacteria bacterium]